LFRTNAPFDLTRCISVFMPQVSDRLISLAHNRLLPREATARLALVESRTHTYIEATFPFLGGIAKFVPNQKLAEFELEFTEAPQAFLQGYERTQRKGRPKSA